LTTALTLASAQGLKATGTATTGTITTALGKGLTTAANSPLNFTAFNGTVAPLTISGAGTVTLASGNNTTVTVSNGGVPLIAGDYVLINKGASGSVAGTAPASVTVNGDGITPGTVASLQITGSQLVLHVAVPAVLKYRSKQTGNWNDFNTWQVDAGGGFVNAIAGQTPSSTDDTITIQNTHIVTVTAPVSADQLTVNTGGLLLINNGVTFTIADGAGTDMTVASPAGLFATAGTVTNNGQAQINGTLRIDQGGNPGSGTGTYAYDQTTASLAFNNTSGSYGVNNVNFWPTVNGPQNVSVASGGITMNVARTVGLTFITSGGVTNAGNLTFNGLFNIFNGGFVSGSPTYGSASTLQYSTGTTYGRNGEWLAVTSGAGYPANVQVSANTTLDIANGITFNTAPSQMSGSLTIDSGSTLSMSAITQPLTVIGNINNNGTLTLSTSAGGDLHTQGNWSDAGTFNPNGRLVSFDGSAATQTISKTAGTEAFDYLAINKAAGGVQLLSDVNINGSVGNVLALAGGAFDLNVKTLRFNNNGGSILATGGVRTLDSNAPNSFIFFIGSKSVASTAGGTLVFGNNAYPNLQAAVDFGASLTTVNGPISLNTGGSVNTNAPTYGASSSLFYNSGGTFSRGAEWTSTTASTFPGPGYPNNVGVGNNTTLDMGANGGTAQSFACNGALSVSTGSTFSMAVTPMTVPVSVKGDVNNSGTLVLSTASGGDIKTRGSFIRFAGATFTHNNRAVNFEGGATQSITDFSNAISIPYVVINKSGGTVQLNGTDLTTLAPAGGNSLTFSNATSTLTLNARTLTLGGTIPNAPAGAGIIGSSASNVTLNDGGAAGDMGTLPFASTPTLNNLTVNRTTASGNVSLGSSLTVNGALTLTAGTITTGAANTLSLGTAATATRTAGYIIGTEQKSTNGGSFTFNVGTANGYTPVDANSTTGSGSLSVKTTQAKQPNIVGANALTRYWTLTGSGITTNLTFHYLAGDVTGTEANYKIFKYSGATFTQFTPTNLDTTNHTATLNGVNSFSDWTLAESASVFGQIQFAQANTNDTETNSGSHVVNIAVQRTGGSSGAVSVDYSVTDGTATTANNDYSISPSTGTLNWADGDAADKTIAVTVNGDTTFEPNETVNLSLTNAQGGATLGTASATLTITNDDTRPAPNVVYVDDDFTGSIGTDPDGAGPATEIGYDAFATIQGGATGVAANGTVNVAAGIYNENVIIAKSLTLTGAGEASVTLRPALSSPNCGGAGGGSLCAGSSNLILVQADNVTISGLTLDGDHPSLTSGIVRGGADVDARNGIITNHLVGVFQNLTVHHTTIKNIYLRGVYASTGGTFNFHHDTVQNVQGEGASIGMFNFGGAGTFDNNNASACNDAIASNHSRGSQFTNNTITTSASGIHTDNAGDGGGTTDTISNNTVTNSTINGYGIWVFVPSKTVTVQNNTATNVDVGFSSAGMAAGITSTAPVSARTTSAAGRRLPASVNVSEPESTFSPAMNETSASPLLPPLAVAAIFTGNTADGQNKANSTGVYLTTDQFGFGTADNRVTFNSNTVKNNVDGFYLEAETTRTLTVAASYNRIINNSNSAVTSSVAGTMNATMENNWWGCNAGPNNTGCGSVVGTGVDFDPWLVLSVSASPNPIAPGGTSTITADMTHNSAAADTSAGGFVPSMPVSFSATQGNVSPASGTITNGQATTTFTSTSGTSGTASATVDNQTTSTNVNITSPSFSINDVTHNEGNSGTTSYVFTVTKTGTSAFGSSVDFTTVDGTATTANSDYQLNSGTLTFASGDVTQQITVLVNGDTTVESDEAFTVHLSNVVGASISDADGTGTITNDDVTRPAPSVVYVDDDFTGPNGADPDGAGPATEKGYDAFKTIQEGINAVATGGTVNVAAGTYDEDVAINNAGLRLLGAGASVTNVRGVFGGDGATIRILSSNVTVAGFTVTRLGNNTTDWNNPTLNSTGVAIQGIAITNALIRDNIITGNRTGIDINNSNGHTVRNNVIDFNRTGLIYRNQTDNQTVIENFITNNWTVGVLFLDGSGGTNVPVQSALHSTFSNNNISANWYGQIVDRQSGGSLPAPGTTNTKNFRGDWFGTTSPVVTTANSAEPGYAAQIPVAYGGTATPPGGQPDIAGPASANFKYTPFLLSGTDTNIETTPGRGTNGFQGVQNTTTVSPANQNGWVFFDDNPGVGTGSGGFEDGPATPPLGVGSAFLQVDAQGRYALGTAAYAGTRMDDISGLGYYSYQNNNTNTVVAPSLQFDIDYDLNDASNTFQGRLVFEPYQSGTVQQNVWQNWDALAGNWYGTRTTVTVNNTAGVSNPCQQGTPCTWQQVLALFPNAGVRNTATSLVLFKAGGPWSPGFRGNVDDFRITVNTAQTTYDFEPLPHLSIDDVTHNEGNAGQTAYTFTVTLSSPSTQTVTVDYATADDSATAPSDYTAIPTTTLTFAPGETTKQFTVFVNGDTTFEPNEQFFVNLSNPNANATILDGQGVGTITNDDAPRPAPNTVYVDDDWAAVPAGADPDGVGPATEMSYDAFSTVQGGVNGVAANGTVNVASGNYPEQVTVSKSLTLAGAGAATTNITTPASLSPRIGGNLVLVQVDSAAVVDMSGITVSGPRVFNACSSQIFYGIYVAGAANLNLHAAAVRDIRMANPSLYGCQDGNAIRAGSQALGQTATLTVNNTTLTGYQKTGIIIDGTGTTGTVTNSTLTGFGPENLAQNAVQIGRGAAATVTGNTITGSECTNAVCGPDPFTQAFGTGLLIFSTSAPVQITNNTISNNDTGVYNNASNTTISGNTMVANRYNGIFLDEGAATVSNNNLSGASNVGVTAVSFVGNGGNSTGTLDHNNITGATTGLQMLDDTSGTDAFIPQLTAHFNRIVATTTAIDNPQSETADFENNWWGCNAGPGNTGCGAVTGTGADYDPWFVLAASASPNSIVPGGTSTVSADMTHNSNGVVPASTLPDLPASFSATNGTMSPPSATVHLGAASSTFTSTNSNSAVATVTVDNQNVNVPITVNAPSFSVDDVTHNEGNSGTTTYTFTVTKTGATNLASSVDIATVDGTATTADGDYQSNSGTLNFAANETTKQFTVLVNGDTTYELNEAFTVHLSNAVGAGISDADGTGTITNDDAAPSFSIGDVYVSEPQSGTSNATFTVTLSAPMPNVVSVDYATADGTATAPADYDSNSGTLTFAAGETTKTITVVIKSDALVEGKETFTVNLSNATPPTSISDASATGTIVDPVLNGQVIISEFRFHGAEGPQDEFVELYNNTNNDITVATEDGTPGWALAAILPDGVSVDLLATIPNGTVIPAHAHFLLADAPTAVGAQGYSLGVTPSLTYDCDIDPGAGVALFRTNNTASFNTNTRLDAAGFNTLTTPQADLYREGAGLPSPGPVNGQYSFVRNLVTGLPRDTNDNAADFLFISTDGEVYGGVPSILGAPGPENRTDPILRSAHVRASLVDVNCPGTSSTPGDGCARYRNSTPGDPDTEAHGTLAIRRKFTNSTGANITRLRFRIVDITTRAGGSEPSGGTADVRALTSLSYTATLVGGGGTTSVKGLTLEPPTQTLGGGINSTLAAGTIFPASPLAPGNSINVEFLLGVQQTGSFRFFIIVEAVLDTDPVNPPASPAKHGSDKPAPATVKMN
jgi:hypothetical protein